MSLLLPLWVLRLALLILIRRVLPTRDLLGHVLGPLTQIILLAGQFLELAFDILGRQLLAPRGQVLLPLQQFVLSLGQFANLVGRRRFLLLPCLGR